MKSINVYDIASRSKFWKYGQTFEDAYFYISRVRGRTFYSFIVL